MDRSPPKIFNRRRALTKWRRSESRRAFRSETAYLTNALADDVAERLEFMNLAPKHALLVGDCHDELALRLQNSAEKLSKQSLFERDDEQPGPFEEYDLIVHLLGLGMVNDLPGALIHARNSLAMDGLFIAAFPGAGSLTSLRQIALAADGERPAARIHPQVDIRAGTALLERAGFARQVVDSYPVKVRFSSLERMIEDLRDHGLTSSLASTAPPITRAGWQRARAAFDSMRDDGGKVTETFEILVLTGWR
ncbi:methyltransferase [Erythrobacter insulae]|uniref:Methyltransferase n=1 Tax=Erythrobacter insulae TaxID=2584124 RepID=A0A547P6X5_9SPHN|nr:methyltransferase [Erythrobacter insulae]TRD09892.1 methyltransferase [Erythrobacter insulae]